MKRYIKSNSYVQPKSIPSELTYEDYWAYKEVTKNWESDVITNGRITDITIWYNKKENDAYARFQIKEFHDVEYTGYLVYEVYDDGDKENITDQLDFTDTLNNCIESCFYYFHTRY